MNLPKRYDLDVGYSAVKWFSYSEGRRESVFFPSVITSAISISEENAARAAERETIHIGSRPLLFGETAVNQGDADAESGISEGWITSYTHTVLILGALKNSPRNPSLSWPTRRTSSLACQPSTSLHRRINTSS